MAERLPREILDEITSLLSENRKIEAIKIYREHTGSSLADAKDAVEALESDGAVSATASSSEDPGPALTDQVRATLRGEGKIAAIKLYRNATGSDLKASKEAVEEIARSLPEGTVRATKGCAGGLLLALTLPLLLLYLGLF